MVMISGQTCKYIYRQEESLAAIGRTTLASPKRRRTANPIHSGAVMFDLCSVLEQTLAAITAHCSASFLISAES